MKEVRFRGTIRGGAGGRFATPALFVVNLMYAILVTAFALISQSHVDLLHSYM